MGFSRMMTVMAAFVVLSAFSADHELPADWKASKQWLDVRINKDTVTVVDFKGNEIATLGNFSVPYPKCLTMKKDGKTPLYMTGRQKCVVTKITKTAPGEWRIDYHSDPPKQSSKTPEEMRVDEKNNVRGIYAILRAKGADLELEYHLTAPMGSRFVPVQGTSPSGYTDLSMVFATNVTFVANLINSSYGKRPEKGVAYEARGVALAAADCPSGRLYIGSSHLGKEVLRGKQIFLSWTPDDRKAAAAANIDIAKQMAGQIMPATAEFVEALKNAPKEPDPDAADIELDDKAEPEKKEIVYQPLSFTSRVTLSLYPWHDMDAVPAARCNNQAIGLGFTVPSPCALFDVTRGDRPRFSLTTINPSDARRTYVLEVTAHDWDGAKVVDVTKDIVWEPWQEKVFDYDLPSDRAREFYFLEARVLEDGKELCFTRYHVATLPPHEYEHRDKSFIGCQCDYPIPDWGTLRKLMKRMGVHWIRGSSANLTPKFWAQEDGMELIWGYGAPPGVKRGMKRLEAATAALRTAEEFGATICEVGPNEANLKFLYGGNPRPFVENNVDWLRTFYEARYRLGLEKKIRLASYGNGGTGGGTMYSVLANGGNQCLDLLSLHPGRLCQVADSHGADWAWHYVPQIDVFRGLSLWKRLPEREIGVILTEVYARTPPNKADSDSLRYAAENVLLSLVMAKTRDVYALTWYKSHDGAYWDINGVNQWNTEYHYGLLLRDGAVKPSIHAFCAAAELLDGAEFLKEVHWAGDHRTAYVFATPRGEAAVLVDRTDGESAYPFDNFPGHLDPWLDHWKTKVDHVFTATKDEVTVIDTIGREKTAKAKDGKVTLTLSGSPVVVYGIACDAPLSPKSTPVRLSVRTGGVVSAVEAKRPDAPYVEFALDAPNADDDFTKRVLPAAKKAAASDADRFWFYSSTPNFTPAGQSATKEEKAKSRETMFRLRREMKARCAALKEALGGRCKLYAGSSQMLGFVSVVTNEVDGFVFRVDKDWGGNVFGGWSWPRGNVYEWRLAAEKRQKPLAVLLDPIDSDRTQGPAATDDWFGIVERFAHGSTPVDEIVCESTNKAVRAVFARAVASCATRPASSCSGTHPSGLAECRLSDGRAVLSFGNCRGAFANPVRPLTRDVATNFPRRVVAEAKGASVTVTTAAGEKTVAAKDGKVELALGKEAYLLSGIGRILDDGLGRQPREFGPYVNDHDVKRPGKGIEGLDDPPERPKNAPPEFDEGPGSPAIMEDLLEN